MKNNELLHEDKGLIDAVTKQSGKSTITTLDFWQTRDFHDVTKFDIIIMNPKGETTFNQSVKFRMDEFDYGNLNHT